MLRGGVGVIHCYLYTLRGCIFSLSQNQLLKLESSIHDLDNHAPEDRGHVQEAAEDPGKDPLVHAGKLPCVTEPEVPKCEVNDEE